MTAANEKPIICPCCGAGPQLIAPVRAQQHFCEQCFCRWSESARLASPADERLRQQERALFAIAIIHDLAKARTIALNCLYMEPRRAERAQAAEGVDDAEYTQGLAYDGVVILKDGQPITIDEVLTMLNARARGGK